MQDNEAILNRLIAEGKARNWQDEPGTMITLQEAIEQQATKTIQDIVAEAEDHNEAVHNIRIEYLASLASIHEAPYHQTHAAIYKAWLDENEQRD